MSELEKIKQRFENKGDQRMVFAVELVWEKYDLLESFVYLAKLKVEDPQDFEDASTDDTSSFKSDL